MNPRRWSPGKSSWILLLLYGIVGLTIYANTLDNPFHYDDVHDIVKNPYLQYLKNIPRLFVDPTYSSGQERFTHTYRPLTYASYYLNYALGGLDPVGYHMVNLGLHVVVAFLLYLITAFLTGSHRIGGWTGMIFLVHPFNSEVVNYITARSSVMATLFYLLSIYAYIRARPPLVEKIDTRSYHGGRWLEISFGAFVIAMLSKEIAVTIPVILYFYEITFRRKTGGKLLCIKSWGAPLFFLLTVVLPYLLLRIVFYGTPLPNSYSRGMASQWSTAPIVLLKMLQLIVFPINLTIEHDIPVMPTVWTWPASGALALILGLVLIAAIGIAHERRAFRLLSFGIVWFFVTQLPTVAIPLTTILQENRGYLSAVGIIFTLVVGLAYLFSKCTKHFSWMRSVQWGLLILVVVICGGMTFQRNVVWDSEITLWQDAVKKSPGSARAHTLLGVVYLSEHRPGLALTEYQKAISINPNDAMVYVNLGKLYYESGQFPQAEKALLEALRRSPASIGEAHFNLGLVYQRQNHREMAIQEFLNAVEEDRSFVEGYVILGEEYALQNRPDLALYYFRKALIIDPGDALSRLNVARLIERQGHRAQAIAEYRRVTEQDPSGSQNQFAIEKAREQLKRLGGMQ